MAEFWGVTLGGLLGSGLATAAIGALLLRRNKTLERRIDEHFQLRAGSRDYQRQALFELYGPIKMQLWRTKRAMRRWRDRNLFLEANVVRAGNLAVRDLLLAKGHLIRPALMDAASQLIEHYDVWLQKFEEVRGGEEKPDTRFVFVGADGYPFPQKAEQQLLDEAEALQAALYGAVPEDVTPG